VSSKVHIVLDDASLKDSAALRMYWFSWCMRSSRERQVRQATSRIALRIRVIAFLEMSTTSHPFRLWLSLDPGFGNPPRVPMKIN
jgi:hypothetical protein